MIRSDIEEKNAKCNICAMGLTYIENLLYGNRCVLCAERTENINLMDLLFRAYYDWKIYQKIKSMKYDTEICFECKGEGKKSFIIDKKTQTKHTELCTNCNGKGKVNKARMKLMGALAVLGFADIHQCPKVEHKKALLRELGRMK